MYLPCLFCNLSFMYVLWRPSRDDQQQLHAHQSPPTHHFQAASPPPSSPPPRPNSLSFRCPLPAHFPFFFLPPASFHPSAYLLADDDCCCFVSVPFVVSFCFVTVHSLRIARGTAEQTHCAIVCRRMKQAKVNLRTDEPRVEQRRSKCEIWFCCEANGRRGGGGGRRTRAKSTSPIFGSARGGQGGVLFAWDGWVNSEGRATDQCTNSRRTHPPKHSSLHSLHFEAIPSLFVLLLSFFRPF